MELVNAVTAILITDRQSLKATASSKLNKTFKTLTNKQFYIYIERYARKSIYHEYEVWIEKTSPSGSLLGKPRDAPNSGPRYGLFYAHKFP